MLAVVGGVAVGLAAGWLTKVALGALHDASAETTLTIAMPFATYLLAEQVEGSGVLAVLTIGLYLRSYGHPALTSGGWLLGRSVWRYADYLITSLVFVLIGFELTAVLKQSPVDGTTLALAARHGRRPGGAALRLDVRCRHARAPAGPSSGVRAHQPA